MSPSWSQQGQQTLPGLGMQGLVSPGAGSGASQSFQSQGLSNGGESEQQTQTPATTVGDAEGRDSGGDTQMVDAESDHRRTDHERKEGSSSGPGSGRLYKLFTEPVTFTQPTPSTDLITTYTLQPLQRTVARFDPVTGEKFAGLKKSYRTKMKGIEGRNTATKGEGELWGLVDPEWDRVRESGQDTWMELKGKLMLDESDLEGVMGLLDEALVGMGVGHLHSPKHEEWKKALGLEDGGANAVGGNGVVKAVLPNAPNAPKVGLQNPLLSKTSAGTGMRNSAPASPRNPIGAVRPDRAGKKRRYDESSYEGYDDDGYDTGGDSNRRGSGGAGAGGGKRQKRKDFPATSPPFSSNPPTATASQVGVRSS